MNGRLKKAPGVAEGFAAGLLEVDGNFAEDAHAVEAHLDGVEGAAGNNPDEQKCNRGDDHQNRYGHKYSFEDQAKHRLWFSFPL